MRRFLRVNDLRFHRGFLSGSRTSGDQPAGWLDRPDVGYRRCRGHAGYGAAVTLYSDAPRCRHCEQKAVLTRAQAEALARPAEGGLIAYACHFGNDWHVRKAIFDPFLDITDRLG